MPARGKSARRSSTATARPVLPREFVAVHKRKRITDAIAELTAEQGYEATKIADIVRRAGVARKTLYDNFAGKEEVFLAAFDAAVDESIRRVEDSCAGVEGWREKIEAGLDAFLGYVAEEPALARMCLIEALSATPASVRRHEDAMQRFVELARRNMPRGGRLPATVDETLIGGVAWIVYQQVQRGEAERARELLPEMAEFMAAPFLDIDAAGQAAR